MPRALSASRRWSRKSAREGPPPCRRSTARGMVPDRTGTAALRSASYSSWPPPMVPKAASSVTAILVPASRGTEPRVAATVTRTQGVADARSRTSTDSHSVIRYVSSSLSGSPIARVRVSNMTDHRSPLPSCSPPKRGPPNRPPRVAAPDIIVSAPRPDIQACASAARTPVRHCARPARTRPAPARHTGAEPRTRDVATGNRRSVGYRSRIVMIGWANLGSTSQGNRIQVSWLTSVTKVSTTGRPDGLA
jgi:hypothetical protein